MVLYHWMNYFVAVDGTAYKYLRFLTPSFTFITGFLISSVYLSRADESRQRTPKRLLLRGLKLFCIVLLLNLAVYTLHTGQRNGRLPDQSPGGVTAALLTGSTPVAFSVLVPISYLLILSAGLFVISNYFRGVYHLASAVSVALSLILAFNGRNSGYVQILSIGMLGISVGYVSINHINAMSRNRAAILGAYAIYLAAITFLDDTYALQIVGVCLSLLAIYSIGNSGLAANRPGNLVVLLGKYSLFAYIAQIAILQALHKGLQLVGTVTGASGAAFLLCTVCTVLSVALLDHARARSRSTNRLYTAIFG
jgi:peptidoglycan/LPS O-acetylase OafA/YrhL